MNFQLKGSLTSKPCSRLLSSSEQVMHHLSQSTKPLSIHDLALQLPGFKRSSLTTTLSRLMGAGKIENVGSKKGGNAHGLFLLAPQKSQDQKVWPAGVARANCVDKMGGTYAPPAWVSARPGADHHQTFSSRGF